MTAMAVWGESMDMGVVEVGSLWVHDVLHLAAVAALCIAVLAGFFAVFNMFFRALLGRSMLADWKQARLRKQKGIPDWVSETTLLAMEKEGQWIPVDVRLRRDFEAHQQKFIPVDANIHLVMFWEENSRDAHPEKNFDFFILPDVPLESDVYELLHRYLESHLNVDETKVKFTVRGARQFENTQWYQMSYNMDDEY